MHPNNVLEQVQRGRGREGEAGGGVTELSLAGRLGELEDGGRKEVCMRGGECTTVSRWASRWSPWCSDRNDISNAAMLLSKTFEYMQW